jgi:hypothetical protein
MSIHITTPNNYSKKSLGLDKSPSFLYSIPTMKEKVPSYDESRVNGLFCMDETIRVSRESANKFLYENKCRIIGGNIRFYQIKHIGLDVYEVRLLPIGKGNGGTILVNVWKTDENGC